MICDIVSNQNINSKQNIQGALPAKDKKTYMWKAVAYTNNAKNPKRNKKKIKQNKVNDFSNTNVFRYFPFYFLIVICFDFVVIYIFVHNFFVVSPNNMKFKLLSYSFKGLHSHLLISENSTSCIKSCKFDCNRPGIILLTCAFDEVLPLWFPRPLFL